MSPSAAIGLLSQGSASRSLLPLPPSPTNPTGVSILGRTGFGMKTLLLIRHAKSSRDDIALPDKDRPLDDRGKRDAPKMGERLAKRDVKLDLILSSPARSEERRVGKEWGLREGAEQGK